MFKFKSDFCVTLQERGFIHQCSDPSAIDALASRGGLVAYAGYDCTAPSLHIGNLTTIMMLHWLQRTGNTPIILLGSATTAIGDPSGKDEARRELPPGQIEANKRLIEAVFPHFLRFCPFSNSAQIFDNASWLEGLSYVDMLRSVGRHFSVNRMLTMDSVRLRLERHQEMSFTEFNYMVLQAYDFVHLNKVAGCNTQIGGSDQWGNIIAGMELGRRMHGLRLYALTAPLVTTASGAKMGKTAQGAVWLDAALCSAYDYWQYWRNVDDTDVVPFLKRFTLLPLDEIVRIECLGGAEINEAKKLLATEATALLHGRDIAEQAAETARYTFEMEETSANLPSVNVTREALSRGIGLASALVSFGLAPSNSGARRLILGKGVKINGVVIENERHFLHLEDLKDRSFIKLSLGKKRHILIRICDGE